MRNTSKSLLLAFVAITSSAYLSIAQSDVQPPEPAASKTKAQQASVEGTAGAENRSAGTQRPAAQRPIDARKLPCCDEFKSIDEMPKDKNGHAVCQARNVWKPICQTPDAP